MSESFEKIKVSKAVIVEGRDDVDIVSQACDALIIPTHGFGITTETWSVIEKAYKEKGIIILTDPDYSGEEIRRKLTKKFPDAVQAYVQREEAFLKEDIGIENARKETIAEAIEKALALQERLSETDDSTEEVKKQVQRVSMKDLAELGLTGIDGSYKLRSKVCGLLGIGYGNSKTMLKKLEGFGIGKEELEEAVRKCKASEKSRAEFSYR
ncbi:MAG TPA: ribonuclease M5 [Mogibacterium sp.]|nr:ribonuclease M5 [Mogibacterium sp.]